MAAIDKLHISEYADFDEFRIWCLVHNPKLFYNFYNPFISYKEWDEYKENAYNSAFKGINDFCIKYPTVDYYLKTLGELSEDNELHERNYWSCMFEDWSKMSQNKDDWKWEYEISVCNFNLEQDRWLLWHCPIKFIRNYLENQCGYKTKWYHKLFWLGKND